MLISRADYKKIFEGFTVTDCSIRSKDFLYFVLVPEAESDSVGDNEEDEEPAIRVAVMQRRPEGYRWAYIDYTGLNRLRAGASQFPESQFVGVTAEGQVVSIGSGKQAIEDDVPRGQQGPIRGGVRKAKTIYGFTYVCSGYRGLARREGASHWTSLCSELHFKPQKSKRFGYYGFEDFDAFTDGEFYCVGGKSDVWRFDGRHWTQIDFPGDRAQIPARLRDDSEENSGISLEAVCCAGDGYVYIGGPGGTVWKGREDRWRLIHDDRMTLPFKDMVWFQDRVYCTSDYGLWEIVHDQVRRCDVPDEIRVCSGNLAAGDGHMLLAGVYGAAFHDGESWKPIFNVSNFQ